MRRFAFLLWTPLALVTACMQGPTFSSDGTGAAPDTTTTTTTSTTPIACNSVKPCPDGFWCDYPDDKCGTGQPVGECKALNGAGCGEDGLPRGCSCGGVVAHYDCLGVIAPFDISADPAFCSDGTFTCGTLECKKYLEYCETTQPGVAGADPTYVCKASGECPITDCSCVPNLPPGSCAIGADGQMRVTLALP